MVLLRQKYIKKGIFLLSICFLGCKLRINLKSVFGARHRKSDFLPIFNIKRQWRTSGESGVLGRGRSPILSKLSKKKTFKKISKIGEIGKKSKKSDFFPY